MSDYPTAQDIARYRRHDNTPELSPAEAVIVARFESAPTPPEVREARVVEEVARAMGAALRDDLGERGLNWEPGIDVARRLLADPRAAAAVAVCRAAQDGGAEEAVDVNGCPDRQHHGVDCPGDACRYAALAPQPGDGAR